ncbi:MAG TPA: transglycosylase SLT domain-containing protein, partial [Bacteroidales bacterium]|nr:transglycosylase SLT domain-containing protein [Bacteroidales bacterium]
MTASTRRNGKYILLRVLFMGLALIAIAWLVTRQIYQKTDTETDTLRRIRERGYLVAATDRNTLNYFLYKGVPMGYQLDLLESFADYLGVPLKILACDDVSRADVYLRYHAADLVALNLPVPASNRDYYRSSDPFGETRLVLVQRRKGALAGDTASPVQNLKHFPHDTVFIRRNPYLAAHYHYFYRKTWRRAILAELPGVSQEELIRRVSTGKIRFALCQENVAMACHRFYRNLDLTVIAFPLFSYGWYTGPRSDSLRTELNAWLKETRSSQELKQTYLEYFGNQQVAGYFQSPYFSVTGNKLSPFDGAIRQSSRIIRWDWRLVASVIYQESNFLPGLTSARNASGLMQLMPDIASRFGADSGSSSSRQIAAGVRYLKYISSQLPDSITHPFERICFTLASYNVGIGKVMAARDK